MIERPYPLEEALFSLREQAIDDTVAASLAALNLGCQLMLRSVDESVKSDFRQDNTLHWPPVLSEQEEPIFDGQLRGADELAGPLSRIMGNATQEATPLLDAFRRQLFGADPEMVRLAALALPLSCMAHPHPLVQVCAAVASLGLTRNPLRTGQAVNILTRQYAESPSELIQELAFIGLSRTFTQRLRSGVAQMGTKLSGWLTGTSQPRHISAARDALLVHGTVFQRHGAPMDLWWRPPSGDLHQYFKHGSLPHLYSSVDHYRWSGGWSDYAREEAAEKLIDWLSVRDIREPDVIAHSHGCNVSMLTSHTIALNRLVLLSCPVHWSSYRPGKVKDVLSIRINWDLVIMADGGSQRFPTGVGIREEVLPFWFTAHDASRRSSTWRARSLDGLL